MRTWSAREKHYRLALRLTEVLDSALTKGMDIERAYLFVTNASIGLTLEPERSIDSDHLAKINLAKSASFIKAHRLLTTDCTNVESDLLDRMVTQAFEEMAFEVLKQIYGTDFVKLISEKISLEEEISFNELDKKLVSETPQINNESYKNNNSTHTSKNSDKIGYGTLVHQEVKAVLETVDTYLSQFGDKKPEAITLNPYEWAVMDLTLRQSTENTGSLHTHGYNDLRINCKANRCYCHHFLDDPEVREIVKTLNNYLEIMGNKAPTNLPIDTAARQKLNNRFEYFFDGMFNLDSKPHLAIQIIRVTSQELYKANYA